MKLLPTYRFNGHGDYGNSIYFNYGMDDYFPKQFGVLNTTNLPLQKVTYCDLGRSHRRLTIEDNTNIHTS